MENENRMHVVYDYRKKTPTNRYKASVTGTKELRLAGKMPHNVGGGSVYVEISEDGLIVGFFDEPNNVWRDKDGNEIAEE